MNAAATAPPDRSVVLYVEDDPDHADLVLRSLRRHRPHAHVVHVPDGEAAIDYLTRTSHGSEERPLLVLLDLRLPKIDGIEVLRTVKQTRALADIPVVVLTTSDSETDVTRAYENSVNSYLVKPDDYLTLDAMLKDLGVYWFEWNVQPSGGH